MVKGAAADSKVSRKSGLDVRVSRGTFGTADRFGKMRMTSAPDGAAFYRRNPLWVPLSEREYSQGIGGRPTYVGGYRNAGPGAYDPNYSTAKRKSPLDGLEFCHTTLKPRLPMRGLGFVDDGPGHAYNVRGSAADDAKAYTLGARFEVRRLSPRALSAPDIWPGRIGATDGHVPPKTTIPQDGRFKSNLTPSQSPNEKYYYAHCKILTGEDYMRNSTTTSLGKGTKTDFGRLGEGGRNARVGPGTYEPNVSTAKATSSLDGSLRPIQRRAT